jgi:hypothetical protein
MTANVFGAMIDRPNYYIFSKDRINMRPERPLKAIRTKCIDCSNGSTKEVAECPIDDCALFHLRFGKNPRRNGVGKVVNLRVADKPPLDGERNRAERTVTERPESHSPTDETLKADEE